MTDHSEDIGNTFGPNGFSIGSSRHVSSSKYPQVVVHEAHEPDADRDLADAYLLPGKDLAHINLAVVETEAAAMGDDRNPIVEGVGQVGEPAIGPLEK